MVVVVVVGLWPTKDLSLVHSDNESDYLAGKAEKRDADSYEAISGRTENI